MEEGRQIEAGSPAQGADKVVRLPRDWLGPREHLVPFGASTPPPAEPEPAGFVADDFWGERSAAIHGVVQAPEHHPPADAPAGDPPAPSPKSRLPRRPLVVAGLVAVAATAAVVLLLGGSPSRITGGARLNIAAILDRGVSQLSTIGPPRIVAQASAPRIVKHVRHHTPRPKPARPHHRTAPPPASTYVAHVSPQSPQPTYHSSTTSPAPRNVTTSRPAASTASSGATVSPTGQNGALGPVQSPNG